MHAAAMSMTTHSTEDGSSDPTVPLPTGPDTHVITAATSGDRCSVCGSEMAPDQRYCVECGHRRGAARFNAAGAGAPRETVTATTTSVRRGPWATMSAGTTLIAGIATLLLAIGVGYLIGHGGNQNQKSPGYTIINNGAGGVGAGAATGSGATGSSGLGAGTTSTGSGKSKKALSTKASAKAIKKAPSAATAQKATKAAASTLHAASGVKIAPATTKQGSSCSAGTAGCQNGKFTGNFFGQ